MPNPKYPSLLNGIPFRALSPGLPGSLVHRIAGNSAIHCHDQHQQRGKQPWFIGAELSNLIMYFRDLLKRDKIEEVTTETFSGLGKD